MWILAPVVGDDPDGISQPPPGPRLLEDVELAAHIFQQALVAARAGGREGVEIGSEAGLPLGAQHRLDGGHEGGRLRAGLPKGPPDVGGPDP